MPRLLLKHCVYGADVIADTMSDDVRSKLEAATQLATEHRFLHWPLEFPEVYEALAVERSTAVRRDLGEVKRALDDGSIDGATAAIRISEVVDFHGLMPVELPTAAAPISEHDIGVVCWMGVLPAAT